MVDELQCVGDIGHLSLVLASNRYQEASSSDGHASAESAKCAVCFAWILGLFAVGETVAINVLGILQVCCGLSVRDIRDITHYVLKQP